MQKTTEKISIDFSVVIPVFNEEENISELYRRLTVQMERLGTYEIIMVDDGSTDRSWELIRELHEEDPRLKGLSFSRNFGHHIAITAGIDHAKGDAVILMDGDLQDPPEEVSRLVEKFREGYDIVYGIRKTRHDPLFKRLTSALFWFILRRFSGVTMPAGQTMLRVLSRRVVDIMRQMREYARFIHGMMAWTGFKVTTAEVSHSHRMKGKSKYNVAKLFRLAFNAITSFSTIPLRLAVYIGIISSFLSLIAGIYFVYRKIIYGIPVLGYASIIVSVFFVGGIQLMVLGIFGEYLGRVYQEVQKRPIYILKDYTS
ncbi:MAG: glycosyltransferase family 2 protein [Nitrospirota bacterium]